MIFLKRSKRSKTTPSPLCGVLARPTRRRPAKPRAVAQDTGADVGLVHERRVTSVESSAVTTIDIMIAAVVNESKRPGIAPWPSW
jgi:hypothetical protein